MVRSFVIFLLFSVSSVAFGQFIKPAFSYTYIPDWNDPSGLFRYNESTFNFNIAYQLLPAHRIGLQYLYIQTSGSAFRQTDEINRYGLAGVFYQYDFFADRRMDFFPELSLNYGNYCTCGTDDPYQQEGLIYFSFGLGMDFPVYKKLYVDTGFHVYRPVSGFEEGSLPYGYTQYVLGLSYKFR